MSRKKWWSTIKAFNNNKVQTSIPPLQEGVSFITDPKAKAEIFNEYFISQAKVFDEHKSYLQLQIFVKHSYF